MNYYPVGIPTLCRYEHFYRCVESLRICTHANKTELVVSIDYPSKESHWAGYNKIVDYVEHLDGFAKITVFKQSHNLGAIENFKFVEHYIYEHYDAAIFSEDDNEFSPNFLDYMDKGLELFMDNPKVMSISGYMYLYQIDRPLLNVFPGYGYSAWGVGEWKNKRYTYQEQGEKVYLDKILFSWNKSFKLFKLRPTNVNNLLTMKLYHQSYGDCFRVSEHVLEEKYSLFPRVSKVRNWGHDGSGEHCKVEDGFAFQVIDKNSIFDYDNEILKQKPINFTPYMQIGLVRRLAILARYIFFRFTGKDLLCCYYRKKYRR